MCGGENRSPLQVRGNFLICPSRMWILVVVIQQAVSGNTLDLLAIRAGLTRS